MRKKIFLFIFIIVFPILSISAEKITLVSDEYWEVIMKNEQSNDLFYKISKTVKNFFNNAENNKEFRLHGISIEKIILGFDDISNTMQATKSIELSENEIIVLSPLLASFAESFSKKYPEKKFIVITEQDKNFKNLDNIYVFTYDYNNAMYNAGKWAAESNLETVAVFYNKNMQKQKNQNAFVEGWDSVKSDVDLDLLILQENHFVNGTYIKKIEDTFKEKQDTKLAGVFASEWTNTILEKIEVYGVTFIAENIINWPNSMYDITGGVEISVQDILSAVVKAIAQNNFENGGIIEAKFIPKDDDSKSNNDVESKKIIQE